MDAEVDVYSVSHDSDQKRTNRCNAQVQFNPVDFMELVDQCIHKNEQTKMYRGPDDWLDYK